MDKHHKKVWPERKQQGFNKFKATTKDTKSQLPYKKKWEHPTEGTAGTVDLENINLIKKKAVRGLFKKRAKQYECTLHYQKSNTYS